MEPTDLERIIQVAEQENGVTPGRVLQLLAPLFDGYQPAAATRWLQQNGFFPAFNEWWGRGNWVWKKQP